ncbi:J517_1871 family lipoprotein [Acinetobacter pollinis]|uniref:J517_1871 family lipoprotein n=1 Tax=Acinetobacter pollinis TaxID=2605270 RepID=UPI0018C21379|nr:J517_1871 family lipoprotein [Acinetobacter pollinis]MBF7694173.1 hypothetical protein [Acinetobacter pollinis]MBF7701752.1 hypothetical protein [Acinetobacter pollinis]
MKKIILGCFIAIALTGCATTEDFFAIKPVPTSNIGLWTGAHNQISVATLKLNNDGTGIICQDYMGTAKSVSVKFYNNKIYTQDGSYWRFSELSPDTLKLDYAIGGSYVLKKDTDGKMVTPACKDKI